MAIFNKKVEEKKTNPDLLVASLQLDRVEIPSMKESINSKFINYGADNQYPQYLIELSKTSALHRSLLENKSKLISGSDITINGMPLKDWVATLSGPTLIRINNLFYNRKYPLRDWIKKTAYDYSIFGAYSTELIWDTNFEYIKVMKHLDTSKIRSGVMDKNGDINEYFYSRDWSRWNYKEMVRVPVFGTDEGSLNQIIYKKDYYPDLDYYTLPSYIGGLTYITLDSELGLFNLSHIQNGLNPGLIFKVPWQFRSPEEKVAFINEFMNHFRGARNNNNPLILSKNGDLDWTIEQVESKNIDQQLIALGDFILQQLIFAHQITNPALVGLMVPGKLGYTNAEDIAYSQGQYNKFVIDPARSMMVDTLHDVLLTYGFDVEIKIID